MSWEPIETAPKDGTLVLLYDSLLQEQRVCFWGDIYDGENDTVHTAWCVAGGFDYDSFSYNVVVFPTQWHPLPCNPEYFKEKLYD